MTARPKAYAVPRTGPGLLADDGERRRHLRRRRCPGQLDEGLAGQGPGRQGAVRRHAFAPARCRNGGVVRRHHARAAVSAAEVDIFYGCYLIE
jgi:hypothetical protein